MNCQARDKKGYICTLKKGHKGDHAAHREVYRRDEDIITTWPNEDD